MNEQKKIRLAILAFSGLLLVGGVYAGITYNNQKQQETAEQAEQQATPHSRTKLGHHFPRGPMTAQAPTKSAENAEDAKEAKDDEDDKQLTANPTKSGGAAAEKAGANIGAANIGTANIGTANIGTNVRTKAATTASAVQQPPAASAGKPAVPLAAHGKGSPAPTVASQTPAAPATPAAVPTRPTIPPIVAASKPPAVPVRPAALAKAPVPPARIAVRPPAITPPLPKAPLQTRPVVPAVRPPITAQRPIPNQNVLIMHTLGKTPGAVPAPAPVTAQMPQPSAAPPPVEAGIVAATTIRAAEEVARKEAGRTDPMKQITRFLPWPLATQKGRIADAGGKDADLLPPPPDGTDAGKPTNTQKHLAQKIDQLIPPPPPTAGGGGLDDLGADQLPVPPSKPIIGDQMKVISVLDDKAIVTFPRSLQKQNNWPKYITLGTGEQFDSIKIISINADGVTIEEDGERSLRPLPTIK
jgi:hypothetical protein